MTENLTLDRGREREREPQNKNLKQKESPSAQELKSLCGSTSRCNTAAIVGEALQFDPNPKCSKSLYVYIGDWGLRHIII